MTGKTPKGVATRQEILRVAAEIFARRGYAATRMDDIIKATGLTKGAIYFHFRSKEELAAQVVANQKGRWLEQALLEIHDDAAPAEQLRALGAILIDLMTRDSSAWNVVQLSAQLDAVAGATGHTESPLNEWATLVADIIARGQKSGDFRKGIRESTVDPDDMAALIVASFDGLKNFTDVVAPGDVDTFRRRATLLVATIDNSLRRIDS